MCDLLCVGDRPRLLHGSGSLRLSLRLGQVRLGLVDLRALQVRDLELVFRQLEVGDSL